MSSMAPKRMHSTTRLSRRPDGFSIFYQHGKGDVEEEMMRVSVITNGDADTLRSSNSESVLTEKPSMKKKKKIRRRRRLLQEELIFRFWRNGMKRKENHLN
uniref:Uncharacterized protein n=1 Tax=Caenorhabditis tropicalis TaxID=1561998 RepID=A0A1I7U494_9PELO